MSAPASPERLSLDAGWLFHLGDIPFPVVQGHQESYHNAKAGRAGGAAAPEYDDSEWRRLDLPHDWVVEGVFDPVANLAQGYRARGFAWYRRHFRLDEADRQRHLELQFDGIATHATVWVNGTLAHRNFCGYTSFAIDLTPLASFGDMANTIAIRVDAEQQEGWWYEGGGIYRHTWLMKRSPVHLATDGVFAQPVHSAENGWTIPVEATVNNAGPSGARFEVETTLIDSSGQIAAAGRCGGNVPPLRDSLVKFSIPVRAPRLWSVDDPFLYEVRTCVKRDGVTVDEVRIQAGFRTFHFDPDQGFFLNDRPLKLKGTCNHQDHAGVGVAVPDALWDHRIRRLKEMGSNAYRCAHNPPAKEFLDACDRLGLLVMDENRLFNPTPEYQRQLEWLVRRDRNHPSVILWSVFNEEPMQGTAQGYQMVRRMADVVRRLDPTRPVTAAMNGGLFSPENVSQAVDVVGFNYQIELYDRFHAANPELPLLSSEDASALMQRGEYCTDQDRHLIESYDTQKPSWGATHRDSWRAIAQRPWLAGGFAWTGFDYRGEPTPYEWPSAGSFFGIMDQCGFPKAAFHLRQALWLEDRPILQLIPHWNWTGSEGRVIRVMALTNVETVSLTLNGCSLGEKNADKYDMVMWEVPYAAGRLEAVGKKDGQEVARCQIETTGDPVALRLTPDRMSVTGDGRDVVPVTVEAIDARGRTVPEADFPVDFSLTGSGAIIGLGNGDPNSHEAEKGNRRSLYHGLAQVILQTRSGGSGALVLNATAPGVRSATLTLEVLPVPPLPAQAATAPQLVLANWRVSPVGRNRPDPNTKVFENDQNSWAHLTPGNLLTSPHQGWLICRTRFRPFASQAQQGGCLVFKAIAGPAEAWINGRSVATKGEGATGSLRVTFAPGQGERTLSLLLGIGPDQPAGLADAVYVEPLDA